MPPEPRANRGIVAGLGCTGEASVDAILTLVDATLVEAGAERDDLVALATTERRRGHVGLRGAAMALGVPLRLIQDAQLASQASLLATPSRGVERLTGLPGVAEAAALCAGPLLVPKRIGDGATCALAKVGGDFDPYRWGTPA